jgi:prevent-host-death family protein
MYSSRVTMVSVTEARNSLPELLHRVERGEEVTITRHGRPVAVVVRHDALRSRRADAALGVASEVHELLERGRRTRLSEAGALTEADAEALLAEVRAGRSDRGS